MNTTTGATRLGAGPTGDSVVGEQPPQCDHPEHRLRRRITKAGARRASYQCLKCGTNLQGVPIASVQVGALEPWDTTLSERWNQKIRDYWDRRQQAYEDRRRQGQEDFWRRYDEHLSSEKWQDLRRRVFARCKGLCEGCGIRAAVQVHHLTYARLGNEMLFDLAAVCLPCHETIHGRPIG
jgi:5-methylcytosine-specific restriction endonuclease McrA